MGFDCIIIIMTLSYRWCFLYNLTVVDEASVWQDGCGGEPWQRLLLSSQYQDVTGRHLGQVCQATTDTWGERKILTHDQLTLNINRTLLIQTIYCHWYLNYSILYATGSNNDWLSEHLELVHCAIQYKYKGWQQNKTVAKGGNTPIMLDYSSVATMNLLNFLGALPNMLLFVAQLQLAVSAFTAL